MPLRLTERQRPRAHLIVDDFFSDAALRVIFREIRSLEREMRPGLVRDLGHDGQSVFFENERRQNRAVWIHEGSKSLELFRRAMWSPALIAAYERAREPLFQIIPSCGAPHLQVSSYMTGDHYDFHEDEGAGVNLTAVVFLAASPGKVRGGDLVLSYDGEETAVRFRHNRLLVFPSKTLHRVTRVRVSSDDPRDARISLQCWLTYGKTTSEAEPTAPTAPAADAPTFLLAEEPIIAAAQSLVASPDAPEQTPESVYWGAFYLCRILTANLRLLATAQKIELGPIRIRQRDGLEVLGVARLDRKAVRVGFLLQGSEVSPSEALSLFVDTGRGASSARTERVLVPGTGEAEASALLGRLLAEARRSAPRA